MSLIIEVKDLSKSYTIAHEGKERYTALRDVVAQKAKKIFSYPGWKSIARVTKEEFWALKDINFEIEQGDRIGIIGRNGAGKSTLLKILSRITEPSTGQIKIKGRVASLLEVGTGFHPELTGRENIFLNGAILGMSRLEIRKHFDAIVDFAEVEKFLDTPVKRYSSGMYVRLAFAVAAHLEPEILVVDEVLAVGDAEFQKKCLGKMEEVSKDQGRTVLFVSHNMEAIKRLCKTSLFLRQGTIDTFSDTASVVNKYMGDGINNSDAVIDLGKTNVSKEVVFSNCSIFQNNTQTTDILNGLPLQFQVVVAIRSPQKISFEFILKDQNYNPVVFCPLGLTKNETFLMKEGVYTFFLSFDLPYLAKGRYYVDLLVAEPRLKIFDHLENIFSINLESTNNEITGWSFSQENGQGCILTSGRSTLTNDF